ncbi:hypothetical protein DL93DRAFT_2071335, partial [Clavulina sp. PMI_390]
MSSKEPALSPRAAELKAQANDFFKREDFEKAHELFTAAIAEESSSPALYSNRSATCVKLKKYKAALKDAEKTVKVNPYQLNSSSPRENIPPANRTRVDPSWTLTGIKPMAASLQHKSYYVGCTVISRPSFYATTQEDSDLSYRFI